MEKSESDLVSDRKRKAPCVFSEGPPQGDGIIKSKTLPRLEWSDGQPGQKQEGFDLEAVLDWFTSICYSFQL